MTLRETKKLTKQQSKVLKDQRRRERDTSGKRKKKWQQEEARSAHQAQQTTKQTQGAEATKARVRERFAERLVNELRSRLSGAVTIDPALYAVNPPITLSSVKSDEVPAEMGVMAYTDFRSITIKVVEDKVPSPFGDPSGLKDFIFAVKGCFHHEAGHILHSWPLWDMWRETQEAATAGDQWAVDFLKECEDEGVENKDYGTDQANPLQQVWNGVEDQRMESARVRDFPTAQRYFEHMMGVFLLSERDDKFWSFGAWALLAGREYLPDEIRDGARAMFEKGEQEADRWLDLVRAYKAATDKEELLTALLDCYRFMKEHQQTMPDGPDGHDTQGQAIDGQGKAKGSATKPGDGSDGKSGGKSGTPSEDPEEIDAGLGTGDPHFSDKGFQQAIRQLTGKPLDHQDQDTLNKAMDTAQNPGLPEYSGPTQPMTGQQVAAAVALQNGIVHALETYVTRATPHWLPQQEDGFIDPCAYRTRETGEIDYNIGMSGDQGEVLDLHLSVMADVSYSMSAHMPQLSVQLLGMKYAADELNIPSNFTIWSDDPENWRIYTDGPEEVVFPALGGTNPTTALNDAVLQNVEDRPNHLFLIFTDGAWYGVESVAPWRRSNDQQFIICKYGHGPQHIHSCDALVELPSLDKFPDLLRDALDNMLDSIV